jgi:hypothetical protein
LNSATAKPLPMQLQMRTVSRLLMGKRSTVLARPVNEGDEMPVALNLLRRGGNARAAVEPTFRLELACVGAPKGGHAVNGRNRDRDGLLRLDDDVVRGLPIRKYERRAEREDVVVRGLHVLQRCITSRGWRTYHTDGLGHRGVQPQRLVHDGVEHRQPLRQLVERRVRGRVRGAQLVAQLLLQLGAAAQLNQGPLYNA